MPPTAELLVLTPNAHAFTCRVLAELFSFAALTAGSSAAMSSMDLHREAADEQRYPWSAVGKTLQWNRCGM